MRVGILGSGLMGGKLGTLFARAGHEASERRCCCSSSAFITPGMLSRTTYLSRPGTTGGIAEHVIDIGNTTFREVKLCPGQPEVGLGAVNLTKNAPSWKLASSRLRAA
jgi:hypothetical protein